MRNIARQYSRELHCHRNTVNGRINSSMSVFEAVQTFTREEKRALLAWLTQRGPFWEDAGEHDSDEWIECKGAVVTETAIAEAAYCSTSRIDRRLVSLVPSKWGYSPITATCISKSSTEILVHNYWDPLQLETALLQAEPPLRSWAQLEAIAQAKFRRLKFAIDSFRPLDGRPFVHGAAYRIIGLLDTLNRFLGCVDESGHRTLEGTQLIQDHFTGGNAWFSDSSPTEKSNFRNELTFPHPEMPGQYLFCTWHGKVRTEVFRVHFSWPIPAGETLYIVYVGPKITKK